jgi:hypothetical protein
MLAKAYPHLLLNAYSIAFVAIVAQFILIFLSESETHTISEFPNINALSSLLYASLHIRVVSLYLLPHLSESIAKSNFDLYTYLVLSALSSITNHISLSLTPFCIQSSLKSTADKLLSFISGKVSLLFLNQSSQANADTYSSNSFQLYQLKNA